MKRQTTQRLFWQKWPYKVILDFSQDSRPIIPSTTSRWVRPNRSMTHPEWANFRRWQKKNLEGTGMRSEGGHISAFLATKEQLELVLDTWTKFVSEVWEPSSEEALTLMKDHVFDVVREHPWYRKYPIRARLLYTQEFQHKGLPSIRQALEGIEHENWYAAGALNVILNEKEPGFNYPWPYGQPYYLYLTDNDDAVMLKLQVGDWIDRFERQRKP